jgi:uncharacterized protein (TIGR02646 family)
MVELIHNPTPPEELEVFVAHHPELTTNDFDSLAFAAIKKAIRKHLHEDQQGLCAYCERLLAADEGQIDHIKPKGGPHGHPHLAFVYSNYAHSCIRHDTCGQKKGDGLLPIEPGPGCNDDVVLTTDGHIEPLRTLTRRRKHDVQCTMDMLGLRTAALVEDRRKWIEVLVHIMRNAPHLVHSFMANKPFRHIIPGRLTSHIC